MPGQQTRSEEGRHNDTDLSHSQALRLRVTNGCPFERIWIARDVAGAGRGSVRIEPFESHDFKLHEDSSGVRYWPKMRCDKDGGMCGIGESEGPHARCSTTSGCAPRVDTRFEVSIGQKGEDVLDVNLVDGFTLPFRLEMTGECGSGPGGRSTSKVIDCSKLSLASCPADEDMGTAGSGVNLTVAHPDTGGAVGCYSPCSKLTLTQFANAFAKGHAPWDSEASPYCCSSLPEGAGQNCSAGPVGRTKFVQAVHSMCPGINSYVYDNGVGLLRCPPDTKYEVTFFCPADVDSKSPSAPVSSPPTTSKSPAPLPQPAPARSPPIPPRAPPRQPGAWKVTWSGGVRVREAREVSSPELGHKELGAVVRGWQDGDWLKLAGEPGFMMVSLKDISFMRELEADAPDEVEEDSIVVRKYAQRRVEPDQGEASRGPRWGQSWPMLHVAVGALATAVSLGLLAKAVWPPRWRAAPRAGAAQGSGAGGAGTPLAVYEEIPTRDPRGCRN